MKPLQRVVWSEGMLMSPHHLQQHDLYQEALLDARIRATTPHPWGVGHLEADSRALENGDVVVNALELVLPSGAVLSVGPGERDVLPSRSVQGHFAPGSAALGVFVGLPHERPEGAALDTSDQGHGVRRFRAESRRVFDVNVGAAPLEMEFAARNLKVLFGDEALEDYECVKVLEIVRDEKGSLAYSQTFVPPCLRVGASSFLRAGLGRLLSLATGRRRSLAEQQRQRDASSVEFHASDVTRFLQLHAMNGAIPWLRHAAEAGDLSPLATYLMLGEWAGQLSTFALEADPGSLPEYQHADLRETFEPLFAALTGLLRDSIAGRCLSVPLESREDGMHLAKLEADELLKTGVRFYLSVASNLPELQTQQTVPRIAKAGAWGQIAQLVSSATMGVPLQSEGSPAKELPVRAGHSYFRVDASSSLWRAVLQERTLAVHLPPPFKADETTVVLLAVPPEG